MSRLGGGPGPVAAALVVSMSVGYGIEFVGGDRIEDVVVCLVGDMTAAESRSWLFDLVGDERWRPGMKVLIDCADASPGALTGTDVEAVAGGIFDDERWGAGMFAVLTSNPTIHGMTRQWQQATHSMGLRTEVFDTRDEAITWLADSDGR